MNHPHLWGGSAGVIPLYQIKDDGQVFLRICGSHPAGVLGLASEEAEDVRHGESLRLFQHWRPDEGETTACPGNRSPRVTSRPQLGGRMSTKRGWLRRHADGTIRAQ